MFKIGDEVTLRTKIFMFARAYRKLSKRQIGPDAVIDIWGKQATSSLLHPVFAISTLHVSLLGLWHSHPDPIPILEKTSNRFSRSTETANNSLSQKGRAAPKPKRLGNRYVSSKMRPAEFASCQRVIDQVGNAGMEI